MFTCKIENNRNNILTLTQIESVYQIIDISGLNPPKAQINTSLTIKINGDVEKNRINLYKFFRIKELCKFYYKNSTRDVYIEGYVETVDVDLFTNNEIMQISILCPNPYFKNAEEIIDDISKVLSAFEFPFAINTSEPIPFSNIDISKITNVYNNSESETGVIIEMDFLGTVNTIQIRNTQTGKTETDSGFIFLYA